MKIKVYSPQLKEVFEITEIRGNAIHTTKGAVLSKLLIEEQPFCVKVNSITSHNL